MEIFQRRRQLIPRWHTSQNFSSFHLGRQEKENENEKISDQEFIDYRLDESISNWKQEKNKANAIDLISKIKLIGKDESLSEEPIRFLIEKKHESSDTIKKIISPYQSYIERKYSTELLDIQSKISKIRNLLREYPNDSLLWNDLSFYYAILGEEKKSEKIMNIAFNASNKHPLIARNFSRLLLNQKDPEKALYILKKTSLLKQNPVIASADMAIKSTFKIGKIDLKNALNLLSNKKINQILKSELFASLGTIEIENGATVNGRKLFSQALTYPTENTIAQAHWMSRNNYIQLKNSQLNLMPSVEGKVIDHYANKEYVLCRDSLIELYKFQPFSEIPIVDAGYISLMALDDPIYAVKLYDDYKHITSHSFMAQNNKAVALLDLNRVDEAQALIRQLSQLAKSAREQYVLTATEALLCYRVNLYEIGKNLYQRAAKCFLDENMMTDYAKVLYHYGIEEMVVKEQEGIKLLEKSRDLFKKGTGGAEYLSKINAKLDLLKNNH